MDKKDLAVETAKATRLRNPIMRVLFSLVRQDPGLFRELCQLTARWEDFHQHDAGNHRNLTALLAGLLMSNRISKLFDLALDRASNLESDLLKQQIKTSGEVVSEFDLIVGTGIHSAIYRIYRQRYFPQSPSVALENEARLGGQFGQYPIALFHLNSRTNRPERPGAGHLPGTEGTLNTFMQLATLQPSDLGMESYASQKTLGDSARVNSFLSGPTLLRTQLQEISPLSDGKLLSYSIDTNSDEPVIMEHKRVIIASGCGEEVDGFDPNDDVGAKIKAEEAAIGVAGGDAKVMTFAQFLQRMSDPSEPFPCRTFRQIIFAGPGNSGDVGVGMLLGYEGQLGKSVVNLDHIEKIFWIGQEFLTKEKFIECARTRYHQIGLEFPREQYEQYYHRIVPFRGRAIRRERAGDKIRYICIEFDEKGKIKCDTDGKPIEVVFEADHAIEATGFRDTSDRIVLPLYQMRLSIAVVCRELERVAGNADQFIEFLNCKVGTQAVFTRSDGSRIVIVNLGISGVERKIGYRRLTKNDKLLEERSVAENIDRLLNLLKSNKLAQITSGVPPPERVYDDPEADPIAVKYPGVEVYKVGPAAGLPLTEKERSAAPALEAIPENTASIFRYAEYTARLAMYLAKKDEAVLVTEKSRISIFSSSRKFSPLLSGESSIQFTISKTVADRSLAHDAVPEDFFRFIVGLAFSVFDTVALECIQMRIERDTRGAAQYLFTVKTNLDPDSSSQLRCLFQEPIVGKLFQLYTDATPSGVATVEIPVVKGRVMVGDVRIKTLRKK